MTLLRADAPPPALLVLASSALVRADTARPFRRGAPRSPLRTYRLDARGCVEGPTRKKLISILLFSFSVPASRTRSNVIISRAPLHHSCWLSSSRASLLVRGGPRLAFRGVCHGPKGPPPGGRCAGVPRPPPGLGPRGRGCFCLLLQYLIQSCARGGRRIVENMCCEITTSRGLCGLV